jgi:hypothetical protein
MMLPNGVITATTPAGGSPYQQQLRGNQAGTFAGAHMVTAATQGASGGQDEARGMLQQLNTAGHQQSVAALNFQDGMSGNEVRNLQKQAANQLLGRYKEALVGTGAIDMPNMARLGQIIAAQRGPG